MTHWSEEYPGFIEGWDWHSIEADFRRVFIELGGADDRLQWRIPIEDDLQTAKTCAMYPLAKWAWHLGPADDELKWWPHLARIGHVHSIVRRSPPYLPHNDEKSLAEFAETLRIISDHLAQASHYLETLEGCASRTRAPVPTERARTELYEQVLERVGAAWTANDQPDAFAHIRAKEKLASFAFGCQEIAEAVEGVDPADYKIGAERFSGLLQLIFNAGAYWNIRFGRPSAERVSRKDGITDPPFVRFVQQVCATVGRPQPTRGQVRTGILRALDQELWD